MSIDPRGVKIYPDEVELFVVLFEDKLILLLEILTLISLFSISLRRISGILGAKISSFKVP